MLTRDEQDLIKRLVKRIADTRLALATKVRKQVVSEKQYRESMRRLYDELEDVLKQVG